MDMEIKDALTERMSERARERRERRKKAARRNGILFLTVLLLSVLCYSGFRNAYSGVPGNRKTQNGNSHTDDAPDRLPGKNIELPEYVQQDFIPVNSYSRPGRWLEHVNAVVIHYVGNPGSTAKANRDYFASLADGRENTYASSHFVVGLRGEVIQCIPLTEVAYASNDRNSDTIAIEVCHPSADGKFSDATYNRVAELTAWLCETFDLAPSDGVIRHYDVYGKVCPRYYVEHPDAWETLKSDIADMIS